MEKREKLTLKQKKVLEFIYHKIKSEGLPPTRREIASHFQFSSTGTVRDYLSALAQKGYIKISSYKSRGIEILDKSLFKIPIVGGVKAGTPELAYEDIEGYLDLGELEGFKEEVFALRIKGDSMIEAGIIPGDLVLVRKQSTADDKDIVVALIESEATVKRLCYQKDKIYLEADNEKYAPIPVTDETSIIGKVITVVRKYV